MDLSGRLSTFSLSDVLQWAHQDRRSGALVVRRGDHEKRLYFRSGRLIACLSDDPGEYYGEDLLLHGDLTREELRRALLSCTNDGGRLGETLMELELLTPEQVRQTLRRRIEDAVLDLFLWPHGVFYFVSEEPPEEAVVPEPIHVTALVMEGARRMDEVARIRRVLPHDGVVIHRGPVEPTWPLTPRQERIIQNVGDGRSLRELHQRTRGSWYHFLDEVYGLCLKEVLDIARVGEAPSSSDETPIADMLLEQAAQESPEVLVRRPGTVPPEVLVELHPLWLREPEEDLPAELAELAAGFDGRRRLGDLLAEQEETREVQLEFLVLQLKEGRLALLPGAPEALERVIRERRSWWRRLTRARPGSS